MKKRSSLRLTAVLTALSLTAASFTGFVSNAASTTSTTNGGNAEIDTVITGQVSKNTIYYSFKTDDTDSFYGILFKCDTSAKAIITDNKKKAISMDYASSGDAKSAGRLNANTQYYVEIKPGVSSETKYDFSFKITKNMDDYPDDGSKANVVGVNSKVSGSVDDTKDTDVFAFNTNSNSFYLKANGKDTMDWEIYRDELLTEKVTTFSRQTDILEDLTEKLDKNTRYYLAIKGKTDPGHSESYSFSFVSGKVGKVKGLKSKKNALTWKKVSGAKGYEIYQSYSKDGYFAEFATTKKCKKTIEGNGYFKVRAFKKVNGVKIYGAWSKVVKGDYSY